MMLRPWFPAFLAMYACGAHGAEHDSSGAAPSSSTIAPVDYDAVFVVNGGNDTVSVIDTSTDAVRATISITGARYPHHVYLSADRSRLALAVPGADFSGGHSGASAPGVHGGGHGDTTHAGGAAVMILDARTGATLKSRVLDAANHNAIFAPAGNEVWTSQMNSSGGAVLVLDGSSLETRQTIRVGEDPAEITFSSDGQRAFVANSSSSSVTVIDVPSKAVVNTITVGRTPVGAWQGTNGIAYVDNEGDKSLTAIVTTSLVVTHTYQLGFTPAIARLSPKGDLWVTDTENGKIVVYEANRDQKIVDIDSGPGAHAIAYSADGKKAYVSNQNADNVAVFDVTTRARIATIPVGGKPNGLVTRAR